ncbi:glutathione S-transferase, partial [Vibrio vulnificus]
MTRRSSGIHAAWHFWYAESFGGESGLREVGLGGIHPLTQRYANIQISRFS